MDKKDVKEKRTCSQKNIFSTKEVVKMEAKRRAKQQENLSRFSQRFKTNSR